MGECREKRPPLALAKTHALRVRPPPLTPHTPPHMPAPRLGVPASRPAPAARLTGLPGPACARPAPPPARAAAASGALFSVAPCGGEEGGGDAATHAGVGVHSVPPARRGRVGRVRGVPPLPSQRGERTAKKSRQPPPLTSPSISSQARPPPPTTTPPAPPPPKPRPPRRPALPPRPRP